MRLWSLVIVLIMVGLLAVAFLNVSPIANTSAPSSHPTATARLSPPRNLAVSYDRSGVLLSWQPAQPAPIGYHIYRATGLHQAYTIIGSVASPDMDTFVDTTDLVPGATYAYTVTSFDRSAESAPAGPLVAIVVAAQTGAATSTPIPALHTPSAIVAIPTFVRTVPTLPAVLPTSALGSPGPTLPATLPTPNTYAFTPTVVVATVSPMPTLALTVPSVTPTP